MSDPPEYELHAALCVSVDDNVDMEIPDPIPIEWFDESAFYTWLLIVYAKYGKKGTVFTNEEYNHLLYLLNLLNDGHIPNITVYINDKEYIFIQHSSLM